jgi:aldehyde:ferredoxin oxidoreductase
MLKLVNIDLSKGEISERDVEKRLLKKYIGGRGLGDRIIHDLGYDFDPVSPESILLFMLGPLTGKAFFAGRHCIVGKSPLTNMISSSTAGGYFAAELSLCDIMGLIIKGKSKKPSYIHIENGDYIIKDASHLWGLDTYETKVTIEKDESDAKVACIGPAGENKVKFASVINDAYRAAARCGFGCVMGSKNLKAISAKSNQKIDKLTLRKMEELPSYKRLREYGSAWGFERANESHSLPIKNFQESHSDKLYNFGEKLKRLHTKNYGCHLCPIGCGKTVEIKFDSEPLIVAKPTYESLACLGANNLIFDPAEISYLNDLCNRYGLDVISTGVTISFYLEYCDKKLEKTNYGFGDFESIIQIIKMIAYRKDLGNILAEGAMRAGKKLNARDLAMHVNGLELPGYNPFKCFGTALGFVTSTNGASHTRNYPMCVGEAVNRLIGAELYKGKPVLLKCFEDLNAILDSLILCIFSSNNFESASSSKLKRVFKRFNSKMDPFLKLIELFPSLMTRNLRLKELEDLLFQNTGIEFKNLFERGRVIYDLERRMNHDILIKAELPNRFPQNRDKEFDKSLERYFKLRGVDTDRALESKIYD